MDAKKLIAQVSRRYLGVEVRFIPPERRKPTKVSWWPPKDWTREFIASQAFLQTWQWAKVRYRALERSDGRCEACGRSKHDGIKLNVDHVYPRRDFPQLCRSR
jgi:5-methylcytosine-specific restriction endonuclease McrA